MESGEINQSENLLADTGGLIENNKNTAEAVKKEWDLLEKERKVVDLRQMGITFEAIAKQVGYSNASGAYHAYERALARYPRETIDKKRDLAEARLERLLAGVWTKALRGEVPAIMAVLKIFERQAKLTGLDAPQRFETELNINDGVDIDEQVRKFAYLIAESRNQINPGGYSSGGEVILEISGEGESSTTGEPVANMVDSVGERMGEDPVRSGMDSLGSDPESENPVGSPSENPR